MRGGETRKGEGRKGGEGRGGQGGKGGRRRREGKGLSPPKVNFLVTSLVNQHKSCRSFISERHGEEMLKIYSKLAELR
jgi:hypothetical protein